MARTPTTTVWLSPKVARLREVSGHHGPWTSAEYELAFGEVREAETRIGRVRPEPPAEVVEAGEARDVALAAFQRAHEAWVDAHVAELELRRSSGKIQVSSDGQLLSDPNEPRQLRKARERRESAFEAREVAADVLARATKSWRRVEQIWRRGLIVDEYHANKKT